MKNVQVSGKIKNFLDIAITTQLNSVTNENYLVLWNELKILRNLCAKCQEYQEIILENNTIRNFIRQLLFEITEDTLAYRKLKLMTWQLLANAIVGNTHAQQLVWTHFKQNIFRTIYDKEQQLNETIDIILMIMFNTIQSASAEAAVAAATTTITGQVSILSYTEVLQAAIYVWQCITQQQCVLKFEFLHIIFEKYIVKDDYSVTSCYKELNSGQRLILLDYLHQYLMQDNPNGLVCDTLLQYMSTEFKLKSDCMLRLSTLKEVERIKPQETFSLLKCVATACGSESYTTMYRTDQSLFLHVSSLLRCLVMTCRESSNHNNINDDIYRPLNKLEEVAPSGDVLRDYQREITYELKTLLVRCIANLLYKNPVNKNYCLETQLIYTLLECTNMDARNPLMKEWSILAIRNACDDCLQIQEIIANLTEQDIAPNDILSELNLQMGSLRIAPQSTQSFHF